MPVVKAETKEPIAGFKSEVKEPAAGLCSKVCAHSLPQEYLEYWNPCPTVLAHS